MLVSFFVFAIGVSSVVFANTALPVDLPDAFSGSTRKIFANYFSPFPLSIENADPSNDYYAKQWLIATGEGGLHTSYGGYLRDRPIPVAPNPNATVFKSENLQKEIRQAILAGIEGFVVDVLVPYNSSDFVAPVPSLVLDAAQKVDKRFKIIIQPDMATLTDLTPSDMAREINFLGSYPSAYRLDDGRLVVAPFLAEARPVNWWSEVFSIMKASSYSNEVAFFPVFLDARNYTAWKDICYGMSNWGNRSPRTNPTTNVGTFSAIDILEKVKNLGKLWMQPVSVQDTRPRSFIFDESQNFDNLMNTWNITVDGGADWAHLVTWNDYSEGTQFNPSVRHGWINLDISSYWIAKMRTGSEPPIVRDVLYLSHRTQFLSANTTFVTAKPMIIREGSSPARDTIQVLAFLKSAGEIRVSAGNTQYNCTVGSGISTCTFPLQLGNVSAYLYREGKLISSVISPLEVEERPYNQNLDYAVSSSRRDVNGAPIPDPTSEESSSSSSSTSDAGTSNTNPTSSTTQRISGVSGSIRNAKALGLLSITSSFLYELIPT
eukprot:TRINITY_DN2683_c0_g1_i2.p1 TRINITY_DN2683_c0_g1~~TRINITY_DN2683_c0_g1_i2.p1  ORF type:complete len:547 (+),score=123.69 TRINITY_DN2683_c0_g1_i2:30-1670(+)